MTDNLDRGTIAPGPSHPGSGRGQSENERDELRSTLASIVESSHDAILSYSLEGVIRSWNSGAERLYGYSAEEAIGGTLDLIIPDDRRTEAASILREVAAGRVQHLETRRSNREGELVDVLLTVSPITGAGGEVVGASAIARDVTEHRQAHELLNRAIEKERQLVSKLKQVDQIKSRFVSTVSHELRTPLTSIMGYMELLIDETDGPLTGSQKEMLEVVMRNSRRLFALIEDVLILSHIESKTFETASRPVNLATISHEVAGSLASMATDKMLELSIDVEDGCRAMGDPAQIEKVLFNLLSNSLKFTPIGGRVELSARTEGDFVSVIVSDTGIGIPAGEQEKLFEHFFRSSKVQQLHIQGTGLGLSIVRQIVQNHGGAISVESEQDKGTRIRFTLPAVPVESRALSQPATKSASVREI